MFEQWFQKIPKNTTEAAPLKVELPISTGIVRAVTVYFPAGCQYLAKCRVRLGQKPLMPRSTADYISGEDGAVPAIYLFEPTKDSIPKLTWELWNEDDTYDHTLWLSCEWTTEEEATSQLGVLQQIAAYLKKFVSRTVAPEEA